MRVAQLVAVKSIDDSMHDGTCNSKFFQARFSNFMIKPGVTVQLVGWKLDTNAGAALSSGDAIRL